MTGNVVSITGAACEATRQGEPNNALVDALIDLVEMAKSGKLRSFVGTGFTHDGMRAAVWCCGENVYQELGALAWLQAEYVHRVTPE